MTPSSIDRDMGASVNEQVREAIGRIEPLRGTGPNFYTVDVGGWGLSAPTRPQLAKMLWDWFNDERPAIFWIWEQIGEPLAQPGDPT